MTAPAPRPIERRPPPKPEWIRRREEGRLPAKDLTGKLS